MLEDLLVARFRPSPVEKVYEAMEGMLRYFGAEIYTPTITSLLGKRRATGIPRGREYCRVYDEVLRAGDVQARSPFWTWGPAAQQALAGLSGPGVRECGDGRRPRAGPSALRVGIVRARPRDPQRPR